MTFEKFLQYTKTAKNGAIDKDTAANKPKIECFFSLCEYSQMPKIQAEKNKAARQDTKNPNITPKKLSAKYSCNFSFWLTILSNLYF